MTKEQLTDEGVIFDKWISLSGICHHLLFSNQTYIYTNKDSYQFFFESSSGLIFRRDIERILDTHIKDAKSKYIIDYEKPDGSITSAKLVAGGADDTHVGIYHVVFDLNSLIGFI